MRRHSLLIASVLFAATACTDSVSAPRVFTAPETQRYQLTPSGTLDAEIQALIVALFPSSLESDAQSRWFMVKDRVPTRPKEAKTLLVSLVAWISERTPQMDPPPNNESRATAAARLVLYMSLYVYSGPNTPVPASFGSGADAAFGIVKPGSPALVQTPLKHAAAKFDAGSVVENTIVVVSQNTNFYEAKCSGPFTTKYCLYPLYYIYESFPHSRFEKPVHVALCHVHTGNNYGPLPGVDHDEFVVVHDKPAPSDYTPGGYPVPDEAIEVLPKNSSFNPAAPIVACAGTAYPQVAFFKDPLRPSGVTGTMLAAATRLANRALRVASSVITPKSAYAIDNGEEHNTSFFSSFSNADTSGHPDLQVSQSALTTGTVDAGSPVTLSFDVANGGTAPSPGVNVAIRLTPTGETPGSSIDLPPSTGFGFSGPLFPEGGHHYSATVTIPADLPTGTYSLSAVASTALGVAELAGTLGDNQQPVALFIRGLQPDLITTLSSDRSYAGQGELVVATITVNNVGNAAAPATSARLVLDATPNLALPALLDTSITVPAIPAGGSSGPLTVQITVPNVPRGDVNMRAYADKASGVAESDEGNNTATIPFSIGYPGVDGVLSAAEIDANTCVSFVVTQPDGSPSSAKLCYRNDASNLYLTLRLGRAAGVPAVSAGFDFHTLEGASTVGDDAIVATRSNFTLSDEVRTATGAVQDITIPGGRTNGAHAWGASGDDLTVETVHPLNSGDVNDIARTPGQSVKLRVTIKWGSPLVTRVYPGEGYFTVPTAP